MLTLPLQFTGMFLGALTISRPVPGFVYANHKPGPETSMHPQSSTLFEDGHGHPHASSGNAPGQDAHGSGPHASGTVTWGMPTYPSVGAPQFLDHTGQGLSPAGAPHPPPGPHGQMALSPWAPADGSLR